jgi:hypothetical protein
MRKTGWLALCLLLCLTATASIAKADSQSWYFTGTNSPGTVPCSSGAPCGEITLSVSGSQATFTVSSLLSGYIFDSLGFNSNVGVTLLSASGEVGAFSLGGAGNEDGWGTFGHNFDTGKNGGSNGGDCVVTGGVPGAGCTFTFTVKCTSNCTLSLSNFEITSTGGNGSGFFAGHLAAGGGNTGFVGSPTMISVDEPSTLSVLGFALFGAGGLLRRRIFGFLG